MAIDLRSATMPGHRVSAEEWQSLLLHDLGLKAVDILEAMVHYRTGLLLVGFKEEEKFNEVLARLVAGVSWSKLDAMVYGWSVLENVVDVQVVGVSNHHRPLEIVEKLREYGQVIRFNLGSHMGGLKGVFNGVIFAKMRLHDGAALPAFVRLMEHGETIQIRSEAIEKTCHRCLGKGHVAAFCRKPAATVKDGIKSKTWAMIAAAPAGPAAVSSPPEVVLSSTDSEGDVDEDIGGPGSDVGALTDPPSMGKRSRRRGGKKRNSSGGLSPPHIRLRVEEGVDRQQRGLESPSAASDGLDGGSRASSSQQVEQEATGAPLSSLGTNQVELSHGDGVLNEDGHVDGSVAPNHVEPAASSGGEASEGHRELDLADQPPRFSGSAPLISQEDEEAAPGLQHPSAGSGGGSDATLGLAGTPELLQRLQEAPQGLMQVDGCELTYLGSIQVEK